MKILGWKSKVFKSPSRLCVFWLVVLVVAIGATGNGQSPALTECTRAFYGEDYALAIQLAEKHLSKYPKDAPVRVVLARAELAQGKPLQAFDELQRALESDAKNIDALYYLSLVSKELSHSEYERLFSLAPDSFRAHQLLAEAALSADNASEAEREFKRALEVNPRSVQVSTELAELKRSQSKFDEAIAYYAQAEKNGSLSYGVAYGWGACY